MEDEHELARATGEGVPEGVIVRGVVVLGPDPRDVPIARMRDDATSVLASIDAGHINPARCLADCACHTLALIEFNEAKDAEIARLRHELKAQREGLGREIERLQARLDLAIEHWPNHHNESPITYTGADGRVWLESLRGDQWPHIERQPYASKREAVEAFLASVAGPDGEGSDTD